MGDDIVTEQDEEEAAIGVVVATEVGKVPLDVAFDDFRIKR
jgi:hypothetical protein